MAIGEARPKQTIGHFSTNTPNNSGLHKLTVIMTNNISSFVFTIKVLLKIKEM